MNHLITVAFQKQSTGAIPDGDNKPDMEELTFILKLSVQPPHWYIKKTVQAYFGKKEGLVTRSISAVENYFHIGSDLKVVIGEENILTVKEKEYAVE